MQTNSSRALPLGFHNPASTSVTPHGTGAGGLWWDTPRKKTWWWSNDRHLGGYPMLFHVHFDTYHLIISDHCLFEIHVAVNDIKVLVFFNPWRYQRNGRKCSSLMDDDHPWMAHRCWNLHVCWKLALIRGDYWNPIRCGNPLPSSHPASPASPACPACLASFALHRFNSSTVTGCFTPGLHILGLPRSDISADPRKITWVPRTEVTSRCRWQKDSHCINK